MIRGSASSPCSSRARRTSARRLAASSSMLNGFISTSSSPTGGEPVHLRCAIAVPQVQLRHETPTTPQPGVKLSILIRVEDDHRRDETINTAKKGLIRGSGFYFSSAIAERHADKIRQ